MDSCVCSLSRRELWCSLSGAVIDAIVEDALGEDAVVTVEEDGSLTVTVFVEILDGARFDGAIVSVDVADADAPVDANSFSFARSGQSASMTVTPLADQNGSTDVTVVISEGSEEVFKKTLRVVVSPLNDAPTVSDIVDQSIDEDSSTGALAFTVADIESEADVLTITAT